MSGCLDNSITPTSGKFTTLTEEEMAADATWNLGTVLRTEPLVIGSSPKPACGEGRSAQEWILKSGTKYVFLVTNTTAQANVHHIFCDWYENTNVEA